MLSALLLSAALVLATPAAHAGPPGKPPATAAGEYPESLVEQLLAAPTHLDRLRVIIDKQKAYDELSEGFQRLQSARDVVAALNAGNHTQPILVRDFLRASLASDPAKRLAAVEAARAGVPEGAVIVTEVATAVAPKPEPKVAPAPAPVVSSVPTSSASSVASSPLKAYAAERLHVGRLTYDLNAVTPFNVIPYYSRKKVGIGGRMWTRNLDTWTVYEGGEFRLQTTEIAQRFGDSGTIAKLAEKKDMDTPISALGIIGGVGLMIAGGAMSVSRNPDTVALGPVVGSAGLLVGSFGVFNTQRARFREAHPSLSYERRDAQRRVETYNSTLREKYGLPQDVE